MASQTGRKNETVSVHRLNPEVLYPVNLLSGIVCSFLFIIIFN